MSIAGLPSLEHDANKSKAVVKFSRSLNVESAFTRMTSEIENILELKNFLNYVELALQESTAWEVIFPTV